MAKVLPKGKLVPQKDLAEMAFRDLKKRKMVCLGTCFVFLSLMLKKVHSKKNKKSIQRLITAKADISEIPAITQNIGKLKSRTEDDKN